MSDLKKPTPQQTSNKKYYSNASQINTHIHASCYPYPKMSTIVQDNLTAHWPFDDDMFWDLWPSSSDSVRCPFVIGNCRWFLSLVTVSDLCQRQQQWFFVGCSQWFCSICLKSPSSWGLLAASDPAIKANQLLCNIAVRPTIRHHDDHNDEEGESIDNEQDGWCA